MNRSIPDYYPTAAGRFINARCEITVLHTRVPQRRGPVMRARSSQNPAPEANANDSLVGVYVSL